MNAKQQEITDRLNACIDLMVFDEIIDLDEATEMHRKLGVLFDLPDMLTYSDLREIAISALAGAIPIKAATAIERAIVQPKEAPEHTGKKLSLTTHPKTETPKTHGETDEGVDTGGEAWFNAPARLDRED